MKRVIALVAFLGTLSFLTAQTYKLELGGIGFAFDADTTITQPESFMIRILATPDGKFAEESSIRLHYVTYPLKVVEFTYNYLEADVYAGSITAADQIVPGSKMGKLRLTLAIFSGLDGGKGTLILGDKTYYVVFYRNNALEGFARWSPELE